MTVTISGGITITGPITLSLTEAPVVLPDFYGALVKLDSNKNITLPGTFISWDSAVYDTNNIWIISDPTKLTVPTGYSYIRIGMAIYFTGTVLASASMAITIRKNGLNDVGCPGNIFEVGYINPAISVISPFLPVVPGDYFEVRISSTDSNITLASSTCSFYMELY